MMGKWTMWVEYAVEVVRGLRLAVDTAISTILTLWGVMLGIRLEEVEEAEEDPQLEDGRWKGPEDPRREE